MKRMIELMVTATILLGSGTTAIANEMTCNGATGGYIVSVGSYRCEDLGGVYWLTLGGVGVDIEAVANLVERVYCPGIDEPSGTYYGLRLAAVGGIGFSGSAFVGAKGTCYIVGNPLGLALAASAAMLQITRDENFDPTVDGTLAGKRVFSRHGPTLGIGYNRACHFYHDQSSYGISAEGQAGCDFGSPQYDDDADAETWQSACFAEVDRLCKRS